MFCVLRIWPSSSLLSTLKCCCHDKFPEMSHFKTYELKMQVSYYNLQLPFLTEKIEFEFNIFPLQNCRIQWVHANYHASETSLQYFNRAQRCAFSKLNWNLCAILKGTNFRILGHENWENIYTTSFKNIVLQGLIEFSILCNILLFEFV